MPQITHTTLALIVMLGAGCARAGDENNDAGVVGDDIDGGGDDVVPAPDSGVADAAPADAVPTDAAPADAAPVDGAPVDAEPPDAAAPADAGPPPPDGGIILLDCCDDVCGPGETSYNCPQDCGLPICGDGTCGAHESPCSCPTDCGASVCGDGLCCADESASSCSSDCACGADSCGGICGACTVGDECFEGECVDIGAGAALHVSKTGSDATGTGSESSPFATIQYAINVSSSGDYVLVHQGIYNENLSIADDVQLVGAGPNITVIQGAGANSVVRVLSNDISIGLQGFTLTGGTRASPGDLFTGWGVFVNGGGPCCSQRTDVTVRNCWVTGNRSGGVRIVNDHDGVSYVENSILENNCWDGFAGYLGTYYVQNNVITRNRNGTSDWAGAGLRTVRNNVIVQNRRYGIYKHRDTPYSISYNDVWDNTLGDYYEGYSGPATPFVPTPGTGEISVAPSFVGPNEYDLMPGSLCIDAGDPDPSFNDLDGTRNDMGYLGGPGA